MYLLIQVDCTMFHDLFLFLQKLDVRLIHECNLAAAKLCYCQILSEHIYSVQRVKLEVSHWYFYP